MLALVILYYLLFGSTFTLAKLAFLYTTPIFLIAFFISIAYIRFTLGVIIVMHSMICKIIFRYTLIGITYI